MVMGPRLLLLLLRPRGVRILGTSLSQRLLLTCHFLIGRKKAVKKEEDDGEEPAYPASGKKRGPRKFPTEFESRLNEANIMSSSQDSQVQQEG